MSATLPRAFAFAARSLVRQPGRASVGILGIAAVGALLFDMLLLSSGLMVSFRELLDSAGFDVRVLSTDSALVGGPRIPNASDAARQIAALPEVADAVPLRLTDAEATLRQKRPVFFTLIGMDSRRRAWTLIEGRDLGAGGAGRAGGAGKDLLVNRRLVESAGFAIGDTVPLRVTCVPGGSAMPPADFRIAGIADFPFDDAAQMTAAASWESVMAACGAGDEANAADIILVASREGHGADAAVAAIRQRLPGLHPATNEEIVARMQRGSFSYFRQISAVLSTITMLFGFLLITVLLTVSVNQRVAEIAAVRALGFSRARVAADVLCQSALLVGIGGLLALPLGLALSVWLDAILRKMPGIPTSIHFFVFEPRTLVVHAVLLVMTAVLAAVYPMRLVSALPIASTLRNEVVS